MSRVFVSPDRHTFRGPPNVTLTKTVTVTNESGEEVTLDLTGSPADLQHFSVTPTTLDVSTTPRTVTITFAGAPAGTYAATLNTRLIKLVPVVKVESEHYDPKMSLEAKIDDTHCVVATPSSLDFSKPAAGTKAATLTVTNHTNQVVNLTLSGTAAAQFSIDPATIAASASDQTVTVTCLATTPGNYQATGEVTHPDTNNPVEVLKLNGTVLDEAAVAAALNIDVGADDVTSEGTWEANSDSTSISTTGELQRFWLGVPSAKVDLTLGANVHGYQHGGFCVSAGASGDTTTTSHIWFQAQGGQAPPNDPTKTKQENEDAAKEALKKSTITFQAEKDTILQSYENSTFLMSQGDAIYVAEEKTFVTSPGTISLIAGPPNVWDDLNTPSALNPTDNPTADDPEDLLPDAGIANATQIIKIPWLIVNGVVGAATLAIAAASMLENRVNKVHANTKAFLSATWIPLTNCARIVSLTTAGYTGALRPGSMSVYAVAGLLAGTPGFAAMHGIMGVAFRSANITQCGFMSAAVKSFLGTAGIQALKSAGAVSAAATVAIEAEDKANLNSKKGSFTVEGPEIEIGGKFPNAFHLPSSTKTINLQATNEVSLQASEIEMEARRDIDITGAIQVKAEAEAELTIEVGDYEVTLTADGGVICGAKEGDGPKLLVTATDVKMIGPDGVEAEITAAGGASINDGEKAIWVLPTGMAFLSSGTIEFG